MTENLTKRKPSAVPMAETEYARQKRLRDMRMWKDYERYMEERPDRSRTMLKDFLKGKYGMTSDSGYYEALERGRKSAEAEAASRP